MHQSPPPLTIYHNLSSKQLLCSLYVFMDETQSNTHLHEAHATHHLDALISDRPCCFLPQEQKQKKQLNVSQLFQRTASKRNLGSRSRLNKIINKS